MNITVRRSRQSGVGEVLPQLSVIQTFEYISFAANKSLLQRPYIVRFTILSLLFVPSTNPFDNGLATEFSTAARSFSIPLAKRESSFKVEFYYFSIKRYSRGILLR